MEHSIEFYRAAIEHAYPELRDARLTLLTEGWDCVAVDVDDCWIFKFPREPRAERALVREHAILTIVRPLLSMRVPALTLHAGPPLFSRHEKVPGGHLLPADYHALLEPRRQRLADQLAQFYAQLHAIERSRFEDVPEVHFGADLDAEALQRQLDPVLPPDLRDLAARTIRGWHDLPPDPQGEVFGFMDGHSWNMAFDPATGELNGLFDFADARVEPLHREFVCSNFVSRDLTARIITGYEHLTGRAIDRERVELLTGILFLTELAGYEAYPDRLPQLIATLRSWTA